MTQTDDPDVIQGEFPDPVDVFYLTWGEETLKQTIPRLDAALQRVITLTSALVGGTIYFVSADQVPPFFRGAALLLFLGSLAAALTGTQMYRESVPLDEPARIAAFKTKVIEWRDWWLVRAYGLLWGGLFFAVLGVLFRWVHLA